MKTALYRHFDKDGTLLYIGISLRAISRLRDHQSTSSWFWDISRVEIQHFPTRELALNAEKIAIQKECPLHNLTHAVKFCVVRSFDDLVFDIPISYETAIAHFGCINELADACGVTRQAANLWKHTGKIPEGMAYKLQVITGGRLRVDPKQYEPSK